MLVHLVTSRFSQPLNFVCKVQKKICVSLLIKHVLDLYTMAQRKSLIFYFAVALVILSTLTQEAEARRKILRGRKVMTRNYYHGNTVPAWAISLMSGIGMLVVGAVLYAIMRKIVLSAETGSLNTYQPALQNDDV